MNVPIRAPGAGHNRSPLAGEIERRRTFAIISHPDAGKTTLTEKLLLFGGAIQMAGQVRARGNQRRTRFANTGVSRVGQPLFRLEEITHAVVDGGDSFDDLSCPV